MTEEDQQIIKALAKIRLDEAAKENVERHVRVIASGMQIRNAVATGGDAVPWGGWDDYWSEIVGLDFPKIAHCTRCGLRKDLEGAHVWIGEDDENYYIVPMCHECNTKDNKLFAPRYAYSMAWVDYNVCTKGDLHRAYDKARGR